MPRNFPRRHQYRIETDVEDSFIGICGQPGFGSGRNPPPLTFVDRFRGFIKAGARFYFRENQKRAAARNDVDFAARASPSPRENAESLRDQESGGAAFGGNADPKGRLPLGSRYLL